MRLVASVESTQPLFLEAAGDPDVVRFQFALPAAVRLDAWIDSIRLSSRTEEARAAQRTSEKTIDGIVLDSRRVSVAGEEEHVLLGDVRPPHTRSNFGRQFHPQRCGGTTAPAHMIGADVESTFLSRVLFRSGGCGDSCGRVLLSAEGHTPTTVNIQ